jgi:heme exporter protein D
MGGYGFYIWTSFLLVFVLCFLLFYRTRKTLRKYEKEFAKELDKLPAKHKKRIAKSSKVITSILASQKKLS